MESEENLAHTWLKEGWNSYLDNFGRVTAAVVAFHVLATLPALLVWKYSGNRWYALPCEIFVAMPLTTGLNLFFVNLARGRPVDYGDIFRGFSVFLNAVAVSVLFGLVVAAGFLMLIAPGIVWGLTYAFAQYAVIDRRTGIKESFIYSAGITLGFRGRLFFIFALWMLIEIFVPDVIVSRGGFRHPTMALDLKPWVTTAFLLKTLVFLPWLDVVMARAYVRLAKNKETAASP